VALALRADRKRDLDEIGKIPTAESPSVLLREMGLGRVNAAALRVELARDLVIRVRVDSQQPSLDHDASLRSKASVDHSRPPGFKAIRAGYGIAPGTARLLQIDI
jgi:hypothetical protein